MPNLTSKNIFLSYGHDEFAAAAERLKRDLEADGYRVWFDVERLKPGGDWEIYIEEGIDDTEAGKGKFVLLMTPHSVRRPDGYCLNELARALVRNLKVVPVMLASCEPPLSICRLQYLDMRDCFPAEERPGAYRKKLERLKDALTSKESNLNSDGAQAKLLANLRPIDFDADLRPHLGRFVGREWIFEQIDRWLGADDEPRVFWLTGPPGVGKSALAAWYSYHRPEVAALHFCRFGHTDKTDPRGAVLSIAYQLSSQYPDYMAALNTLDLEALTKKASAEALFDVLLVQQLPAASPRPGHKALIVIDGLDEATSNRVNPLAKLLAEEFDKTPDWLKLLVTSRPEPEVTYALQAYTPVVLRGASSENTADAREFIVREYQPYAPHGHVPAGVVEEILQRSEGIFLYLEWVRRELEAGSLSLDRVDAFPKGLGGVYAQFFSDRFADSDREEFESQYRPVLEAIVAAREPLEPEFLTRLFGWSVYDRRKMLAALGSMFVDVTGRVQPFHRTLVEWLTDDSKAGMYFVDRSEGERRLADSGWESYGLGAGQLPRYFLKHLPAHLAAAGQRQPDIRRLLLDFEWLRAKLDATSVSSLLEDFKLLTRGGEESDRPTRLVREALQLSAHVLAARKQELPGQLTGRLLTFRHNEIRRLLEQAAGWRDGPWLKPLSPDLNAPGSPLVATLAEPAGGIGAAVITADGGTVVYATGDVKGSDAAPAVKLWRVDTADPPVTLAASRVSALAVSPDGSALALAAADGTVSVRPLGAGVNLPFHTLAELPGPVVALAFVHDSAHLMLVYESGHVQWWNLAPESPELIREADSGLKLREHIFYLSPTPLAVAPEANVLLTSRGFVSDGRWHVWDIDKRRVIESSPRRGFDVFAATPDATRLICGLLELEVWDRGDWASRPVLKLPGHGYVISALAITPDGAHAVSASFNELKVWDLDPGRVSSVPFGRGNLVKKVLVTRDGAHAAALHYNGTMSSWDVATRRLVSSVKLPTGAARPVFPTGGTTLLAVTGDGRALLGGDDGLHSHDVAGGETILEAPTPAVGNCVAVTPDGTRAITATPDGRLVIWEIKTGRVLHTLDAHFSSLSEEIAFFPDGNRAAVCYQHSIVVWDLVSGQPLKTLEGHADYVDKLVVGSTPAGIRIVSGSRDKMVRVWDLERAEPLLTLVGHTYSVWGVGVLPGGSRLYSCSGDNSLRIWDMTDGRCEATFTADTSLTSCACTPDGKVLVAGDLAGQLHFLELVGAGGRLT